MLVCGLHAGHNAAAAMIRDGRLVGAVQEERPTRIKNWIGFPERAVEILLEMAGASWSDVDARPFAGREWYLAPGSGQGDRDAAMRGFKGNTGPAAELRRRLRRTPLRDVLQRLRRDRGLGGLTSRGVDRPRRA